MDFILLLFMDLLIKIETKRYNKGMSENNSPTSLFQFCPFLNQRNKKDRLLGSEVNGQVRMTGIEPARRRH